MRGVEPVTAEVEPVTFRTAGSASTAVAEGQYDASAITVLEGLDAVRKRPGMYIGSTGERGLHHLVYEIVDNSVDEALAGYCDTITVTLLPNDGVRVADNGRGFPVDLHPKEKIPAVTLALTVLHAGGKFGDSGYKVSGGLHGVGASVVNALSDHFTVDVRRDGYHWQQSFSLGVPDADLERLEPLGPDDEIGTTVTFYASPAIFETTHYNWDTLVTRFREMAFLNKGLTINLSDERPPEASTEDEDGDEFDDLDAATKPRQLSFRYDDGLIDYVKYLTGSKDTIHPSVIAIDATNEDARLALEVAMQWNVSYTESVHTFANTINTHEGGTHEEGFRAALTNTVNRWGETWGMIKKKEDRPSGDDIREGLTAIISVKIGEPQFEGQTKTKLGNTEVKGFVQKVVNEATGSRRTPPRARTSSASRRPRRPPGWRPARRATWLVGARGCSDRPACPASSPTAVRAIPRSARSSSSRATPRAARRRAAATRARRRSCRSAARSSTSRRRGSIASWRTRRSRRSSMPSAPGSPTTSTSSGCATTS